MIPLIAKAGSLLSGRSLAAILIGAAVLVAGTVIWYQSAQIKSARAEVEALHDQLTDAEVKIALLRENRDVLANRLERQTAQVRELERVAADARERANIAASVVLRDAESRREADAEVGSDPEAMNTWLHELFP